MIPDHKKKTSKSKQKVELYHSKCSADWSFRFKDFYTLGLAELVWKKRFFTYSKKNYTKKSNSSSWTIIIRNSAVQAMLLKYINFNDYFKDHSDYEPISLSFRMLQPNVKFLVCRTFGIWTEVRPNPEVRPIPLFFGLRWVSS